MTKAEYRHPTFEKQRNKRRFGLEIWATWCSPCRVQAPYFIRKLSEELSEMELKILKMDVDENPETWHDAFGMSIL